MHNTHHPQTAKFVATCSPKQEIIVSDFPTWKTVKLGTHKSPNEFRKALKANGNRIGYLANYILGKPAFTVSPTETEVDLVVVTAAELGFENGAKCKDIYKRAMELGMELCPNEVGPQLRLQYKDQSSGEWLRIAMGPITVSDAEKDQSSGEWLRIAMGPITVSDSDLAVFHVGADGGDLWLNAGDGDPDSFWSSDDRWVFLRRK